MTVTLFFDPFYSDGFTHTGTYNKDGISKFPTLRGHESIFLNFDIFLSFEIVLSLKTVQTLIRQSSGSALFAKVPVRRWVKPFGITSTSLCC